MGWSFVQFAFAAGWCEARWRDSMPPPDLEGLYAVQVQYKLNHAVVPPSGPLFPVSYYSWVWTCGAFACAVESLRDLDRRPPTA